MHEIVELSGRRVKLRTTTDSDRGPLIAIRSSAPVQEWWRGDDLLAELDSDLNEDSVHRFTIRNRAASIVGWVQFIEVGEAECWHASVEVYIDANAHRQGYASDAIQCLADYLFDVVGHHRLTFDPAADNSPAIACYSKAGFKPVGVLRGYERRLGRESSDGLLMDMLISDRPIAG